MKALLALALAGCGGVPAAQGLNADLRVAGAQFLAGELPGAPGGGPAVVSLFNSRSQAFPGQRDKPLRGTLAAPATAAAIALDGDPGYWIALAGVPDLDAPGLPTFTAALSFAPATAVGPRQILVRAVDQAGRFGPVAASALDIAAPTPAGAMVIALRWDTEADLDLHVVDPAGVEVWARNVNSYTPGPLPDAVAWQAGGQLDFDSNAGCLTDGRRQEDVVWKSAAPPGRYLVRVETASLCGEDTARWTVEATRNGTLLGRAAGQSLDSDARQSKGAGGGVTALELDVFH